MAEQGSDSEDLTASLKASSDWVFDIYCDVCFEEDNHLEATGFCVECGEYLCADCVKAHAKQRPSRNHVVHTKSQMPRRKPSFHPPPRAPPSTTETCDLHPERLIEYYCRDDGTLICTVCLVKHRQCRAVDHISELSEHLLDSEEYQHFTVLLTKLKTKSKDVIKNAKENTKQAETVFSDVATAKQDLRRKMVQAFDKLDTDIKKKTQSIKSADLKKMNDIGDKGKDVLSEVETISAEVKSLQSSTNLGQLFVRIIKLEDTVQALNTVLDEAAASNSIVKYMFEPGTAAQEFLNKPDSIGKLSAETPVNTLPESQTLPKNIPVRQMLPDGPSGTTDTKFVPANIMQHEEARAVCPEKIGISYAEVKIDREDDNYDNDDSEIGANGGQREVWVGGGTAPPVAKQNVFLQPDLNTIVADFIEVDAGKFRFMCRTKSQELVDIQTQYVGLSVEVVKVDEKRRKGFRVKGTKDGCQLAVRKIKQLLDGILLKDCSLTHPYVHEFIHSSPGKDALRKIEMTQSCVLEIAQSVGRSNAPCEPESLVTCRLGPIKVEVSEADMTNTLYDNRLRTKNKFKKSFGTLTVEIVQGDITRETSDVIVNSILRDLNLNTGNVSKAILTAAGHCIQSECDTTENHGKMTRDGVVVTSAGRLPYSKKIYHVDSQTSESGWEKIVRHCLGLADRSGFSSMSFPALWTGGKGCSPESVTKAMFEAFRQFSESTSYKSTLRTVRIVVFQPEMVAKFVAAASRKKSQKSFRNPFSSKKPSEQTVTVYVYADSSASIRQASRELEDLLTDEETCYAHKTVLQKLEKNNFLQDKYKRSGIEVSVSASKGHVKLRGHCMTLIGAKDEVNRMLSKLETEIQKSKETDTQTAVSLPSLWSRMSPSDTLAVIPLTRTDADYIAVANRFLTETSHSYTIVKIERVQNPRQYNKFATKKAEMIKQGVRTNEKVLWHATSHSSVTGINQMGFCTFSKTRTPWGNGSVFIADASVLAKRTSEYTYCTRDCNMQCHLYLSDVLVGEYCIGQQGLTTPPQKAIGTYYNSTIDTSASLYVIYDDTRAYPSYHVVFQ